MGDSSNFGFGKFVPGFDFLKGLTQDTTNSMAQLPNLSNWIAPTVSVEELDKRIDELKAVQFWLEQNARALVATIQALQVQKMTLVTLKGMNFNMGDVAHAFSPTFTATEAPFNTPQDMVHPAASKKANSKASQKNAADDGGNAYSENKKSAQRARPKSVNTAASRGREGVGTIDPMQWWNALSHQFQQIAASAMKEGAQQAAAGREKKERSAAPVKAHAKAAKKKTVDPFAARPSVKKAVAEKPSQRTQPKAVV